MYKLQLLSPSLDPFNVKFWIKVSCLSFELPFALPVLICGRFHDGFTVDGPDVEDKEAPEAVKGIIPALIWWEAQRTFGSRTQRNRWLCKARGRWTGGIQPAEEWLAREQVRSGRFHGFSRHSIEAWKKNEQAPRIQTQSKIPNRFTNLNLPSQRRMSKLLCRTASWCKTCCQGGCAAIAYHFPFWRSSDGTCSPGDLGVFIVSFQDMQLVAFLWIGFAVWFIHLASLRRLAKKMLRPSIGDCPGASIMDRENIFLFIISWESKGPPPMPPHPRKTLGLISWGGWHRGVCLDSHYHSWVVLVTSTCCTLPGLWFWMLDRWHTWRIQKGHQTFSSASLADFVSLHMSYIHGIF